MAACAPADVGIMVNKPAPNRAAKAARFMPSSYTWTMLSMQS
jgi:hypothetical protein